MVWEQVGGRGDCRILWEPGFHTPIVLQLWADSLLSKVFQIAGGPICALVVDEVTAGKLRLGVQIDLQGPEDTIWQG